MAAKSLSYSTSVLELLLNATPISNIADNAATSPLTDLYVALHSASPTATGTQDTNEITYTGYARVAVSRSNTSPAWTVVSGTVSGSTAAIANPNAAITFPSVTSGTGTATYFSVGALTSGAGELYYIGTLSPTISIVSGAVPQLTTATEITEE